ncbi:polymeric immunoglobulin receptor-like [Thunnus thynnus]|uniref:polymeric immunoglobulin receptor-like n=1 Tax=Thunnus thynnus TaxID=8237 RepID=UPI003529A361
MSFIPHLILAGLIGIHCQIITVSRVSVKAGGSISIPCLYDQDYRNHVKYLCQGYYLAWCHIVVKTNQRKSSSGKFSISDDTNQGIFTVTINKITHKDTDFWCVVEIVSGKDVGQYFQLSVTTGMSNLYVDQQEITASEGGSVTINCHYKYSAERKWCRLGRTCVTNQFGSIDGTAVTIDASVSNVFTVTMSKLRTESSGWYWCAAGDLQMPVNVTVKELPTASMSNLYVDQQEITAFKGRSVTINCHYKYSAERKWCRLGHTCVTDQFGSIDGTAVTIISNVFTVTMSKLRTESSGWYWCAAGDLQMPVHGHFLLNHVLPSPQTPP